MLNFAIKMSKKEEQQKIKQLLVEAITLLCRDGLQYEVKFRVEALIGITLDDDDVVLININEHFYNESCSDNIQSSSKRRRSGQSFDNQVPNNQVVVKDELYDEEVNFNNEETDNNFQTNIQNVDNENNYLNSDSNNQNEIHNVDENDTQYDNSNMTDNQLSDTNLMYIKSEDCENTDSNNWMMNNNEFELADDVNNYTQQQTPQPYTSRPGPYSLPMRRQRGKSRPSYRPSGQQKPHINQNSYMPSQQSTLQENLVPLEVLNQISTHQTSTKFTLKKELSDSNNNSQTNTKNDQNPLQNSDSINSSFKLKSTKSSPQCWVCYRTFCSSQALRNHVDVKHLNKMTYKCMKCGESFKWRTGLCKHRRDLCPFRFHDGGMAIDHHNIVSQANVNIKNSYSDDNSNNDKMVQLISTNISNQNHINIFNPSINCGGGGGGRNEDVSNVYDSNIENNSFKDNIYNTSLSNNSCFNNINSNMETNTSHSNDADNSLYAPTQNTDQMNDKNGANMLTSDIITNTNNNNNGSRL